MRAFHNCIPIDALCQRASARSRGVCLPAGGPASASRGLSLLMYYGSSWSWNGLFASRRTQKCSSSAHTCSTAPSRPSQRSIYLERHSTQIDRTARRLLQPCWPTTGMLHTRMRWLTRGMALLSSIFLIPGDYHGLSSLTKRAVSLHLSRSLDIPSFCS